MLTSELIRPRLRIRGTTLHIEMVHEQDPFLQQIAQDLIRLLQSHWGHSQAAWEGAVRAYEGAANDSVLVRGLAKVLADAATFAPVVPPVPPETLREQVFAHGPVFATRDMLHPLTRQEVLQEAADALGRSVEELEEWLFADRRACSRLTETGPAWTPMALLARYNLELARGALYWASRLTIEIWSNYKDVWKFIKRFQLMFWAEPMQGGGYRIELDGPLSPFVTATLRYGRQLAAFLPAVLLCERWQMRATVCPPHASGEVLYQLDQACGLRSHFKGSGTFDSKLEAEFAEEFQAFQQKVGERRGHWRLVREPEVLLLGDTVMIPDFLAQDVQDAHRQILVELVGFWAPTYLKRKIAKTRAAHCRHLLLVVFEGLNVTKEDFEGAEGEVLFFKHKPVLKDIMAAIESLAERVYGPRPTGQHKQPSPSLSLEALVRQAQENVATLEKNCWSLTELKAIFKGVSAAFTPGAYGHASLSALVQAHPDLFDIRRSSRRGRPLEIQMHG